MPNILLIEDDKTIAEAFIFALERDGFDCAWFALGAEGINYFENNKVDLILLDLTLPDVTGFDVLRIIRDQSNVPILVVSAREAEADQILTIEGLGANDHIVKNSGMDTPLIIVSKIRKQLLLHNNTPVKKKPSVFRYDENLRQVLFKNQALELTLTECKILAHMIKNPNKIFSKAQLMSMIHNRPVGSNENTITTHIKAIRRKIKAFDDQNQYIKTHRGEGYSLIV